MLWGPPIRERQLMAKDIPSGLVGTGFRLKCFVFGSGRTCATRPDITSDGYRGLILLPNIASAT
jgi:hypothetical protein